MDIKAIAVQKALAFLKSAGADYIVRYGEETHKSDNCPFDEAPPEKAPYKRRRINNFANSIGYIADIDRMEEGDTRVYCRDDHAILETDEAWKSFKASVHSKMRNKWGKDNFIYATSLDDKYVEVLRAS